MRVLMLSDVFFPRVNGVSTSIRTFRRDLEALGHEVVLVAPDYPGCVRQDDDVVRVPSRHIFFDPEDRLMRGRDLYWTCRALALQDFDVVHVHTPFRAHSAGLTVRRLTDLPLVETCHTHFEEYLFHYAPILPKPMMRGLARTFCRNRCRGADHLVAPSSAMLDVLRGYGISTPATVLPTGIDEHEFRDGDGPRFRTRHGIPLDAPLLLILGRVAFEKNLDFLIRVFARVRQDIPKAILVMAGEGPALEHLKRLARELNLPEAVRFVGYLERGQALADCYQAADAMVFASRTETQGLVLLEAMSSGTPVVSTSAMGTRDIMAPARGGLVAPEDEDAFAARVVCLLRDPDRRLVLGQEARMWAGEWSSRAMARRLADLYARVIEVRSSAVSPVQDWSQVTAPASSNPA